MKPFRTLGETHTPDGSRFTLHEHDGEFFFKLNGRQLMSSSATTSERVLAELACEHLTVHREPRILIGGLGLGFSLRRVLELVGRGAQVQVAELLPEVVAWNREFLREVNGRLLDDPRVEVLVGDVFRAIRRAAKLRYDAILLDVDNGPTSLVLPQNARLYDRHGFGSIARALNPNGRVAFWSAAEEPGFVRRLTEAGFRARSVEAKAHERAKRFAHRIYVAEFKGRPSIGAQSRPPRGRRAARPGSVS